MWRVRKLVFYAQSNGAVILGRVCGEERCQSNNQMTEGWLVKPVQRRVVSEELLVGTEIPGGLGGGVEGERGRLYLTLHCHHQNDS